MRRRRYPAGPVGPWRRRYADDLRWKPGRAPFSNRVTAAYNLDYVRPSGRRWPTNPNRFGADVDGRIGDASAYRRPYLTDGGTWTSRGIAYPPRGGYRAFGPDYGGRYPDELD